jgi:hypothetical protein
MNKFLVKISYTEYATIEVMAKNADEAEEKALENIDFANWGNDETEIMSVS